MMHYYCMLLSLLLLSGCSSNDSDNIKNKNPEILYSKAMSVLKTEDYTDAASIFKEIETLFPYSSKATDGQIMAAYSNFLASNYQDAMRELEIFIRYHSSNRLFSYALYLRAMCMYMQVLSIGRDAHVAKEAKEAFMELSNRFPNSIYYSDSLKRIVILDDIIAAHEMLIGKYYQDRANMLSAIGRYNFIINNYGNTNHAIEAYYRIIECCKSIGLNKEANDAYTFLKEKFGNSIWKEKADTVFKCNKRFS